MLKNIKGKLIGAGITITMTGLTAVVTNKIISKKAEEKIQKAKTEAERMKAEVERMKAEVEEAKAEIRKQEEKIKELKVGIETKTLIETEKTQEMYNISCDIVNILLDEQKKRGKVMTKVFLKEIFRNIRMQIRKQEEVKFEKEKAKKYIAEIGNDKITNLVEKFIKLWDEEA